MTINDWQQSNVQTFWGEIAPTDHLVQIYEDEQSFLNSLEGFVGSGFINDTSIIAIATEKHLKELNKRLISHGFDVSRFIADDRYLPIDAEEALENFMINGKPDEVRFLKLVNGLFGRAKKNEGKVRAFGEMVAILWSQGNKEAAIELETLWNKFCNSESLCLYCAYPKKLLTTSGIECVCAEHSKIISGYAGPSTQVRYKALEKLSKAAAR